MTPKQIKNKVLKYKDWEWWAERPFGAFIMSLQKKGQTREYMKKIGPDVEWPVTLFQKGAFYKSSRVWDLFAKQIEKYLATGGSAFIVSRSCELHLIKSRKKVAQLIHSKISPQEKLRELDEILSIMFSYVWLTHGLEHVYKKRLYQEAPKHVTTEVDKFIGDISFPKKKNAHHHFEKALRGTQSFSSIQKKFGWIKVRDGFSDIFTTEELAAERTKLRNTKPKKFKQVKPPKALEPLVEVARELVYFRTLRTDVLYELMYLSRPILAEVGKLYNIPLKELRDYAIWDLIEGKPKKHPFTPKLTVVSFGKEFAMLKYPILKDKYKKTDSISGLIANNGLVRGKVKIVKTAHEIGKVNKGDILFAPTTFPSFIMGMKKAAAFVTDEGGITSHAAIVSREMNKPCIIGTKIGTKIFKDGDMVEVDANKGIIRKI